MDRNQHRGQIWTHRTTKLKRQFYFYVDQISAFHINSWCIIYKADSKFAPSQWETALLCKDVSHWLGASLESTLIYNLCVVCSQNVGNHWHIMEDWCCYSVCLVPVCSAQCNGSLWPKSSTWLFYTTVPEDDCTRTLTIVRFIIMMLWHIYSFGLLALCETIPVVSCVTFQLLALSLWGDSLVAGGFHQKCSSMLSFAISLSLAEQAFEQIIKLLMI